MVKKMFALIGLSLLLLLSMGTGRSYAQCSICTRSAQQMGEKPGKALNAGIIYLAFTPLAVAGVIGFRWYKQNRGV